MEREKYIRWKGGKEGKKMNIKIRKVKFEKYEFIKIYIVCRLGIDFIWVCESIVSSLVVRCEGIEIYMLLK